MSQIDKRKQRSGAVLRLRGRINVALKVSDGQDADVVRNNSLLLIFSVPPPGNEPVHDM